MSRVKLTKNITKEHSIECSLETIIKNKNLTISQLSNYLNLSEQQLAKYSNGEIEMSLKILMQTCSFLQCNPEDIYPNIIIYDKGIEIPKSTSFLGNFFNNSNLRLFDTNSYGALLFKIAVFIICIDSFLYLGFRTFGFTYAPFIGNNDYLGQLLWAFIIFTWPMSFIFPLLIKHWSVYVLTLLTFRGMLGFVFDIWNIGLISNWGQLDAHNLWLMKTAGALVLTLGYAWIVKTYLRKPINTKTKTA